jgi:hypothetical protein
MQKIGLFFTGLWLSGVSLLGQAAQAGDLTHDAEKVKEEIETLIDNSEAVFDAVVPVILAVIGLGVLITFLKMIKKR